MKVTPIPEIELRDGQETGRADVPSDREDDRRSLPASPEEALKEDQQNREPPS
jgi:hypothetical protein